jgi:prolyl-tRNA editing enzyme YbaK/EbsC (Cys-tRNA(Pro) deacylase)
MMGGSASHEFMAISEHGEDVVLICPTGDYAANREVARFRRDLPPAEELLPLEEVATPNTPTIQALADFLGVPLARTAKAVFFVGDSGRFVFAVIRGDLDVNETKLRKASGEAGLTPATVEQIRAIGAEPGYGSPVGVHDALVVADESVRESPNLVAGANRPGYHLRNANLGRDWQADVIADIASAEAGLPCPRCGTPLVTERAIEVGNIFKLGTRYSQMLGATYLDADGQSHPIVMGSYGIGSGRVTATIAEQHHDEKGIAWPATVAPYHVAPALDRRRQRHRRRRGGRCPLRGAARGQRRDALRRPAGPARRQVQRRRADRLPDPALGQRPHARERRGRDQAPFRRRLALRPARPGGRRGAGAPDRTAGPPLGGGPNKLARGADRGRGDAGRDGVALTPRPLSRSAGQAVGHRLAPIKGGRRSEDNAAIATVLPSPARRVPE